MQSDRVVPLIAFDVHKIGMTSAAGQVKSECEVAVRTCESFIVHVGPDEIGP